MYNVLHSMNADYICTLPSNYVGHCNYCIVIVTTVKQGFVDDKLYIAFENDKVLIIRLSFVLFYSDYSGI